MPGDVFICHSSEDADTASAIVAGLEADGVSCWIAPRDVPTGQPYASGIVNGIRSAKMMLFVFSEAANRSPHIERELERAVHGNIPILPVRIEDAPLSDSLEYFISSPHWFEAHEAPIDRRLPELVGDVRRILGEAGDDGTGATPLAVAPKGRSSKRNALIAAGAAAMVVVLAVAGWLVLSSDGSASAGELFLEPASEEGQDPFTSSFAAFTPDSVDADLTDPPESDGSGSSELTSAVGSDPGLYGGSNELAVCDSAQLAAFLDEEPDKASAFAGVLGIEPDGVADYVSGLTPLVLRSDVRVTNHGFASGSATSFQAVLQSGTAVLVDDLGVPRVKCNCGNPLTPPDDIEGGVTYAGAAWAGYDPASSVVVTAADAPVESFEVANLTGPPEIVGAVDLGGMVSASTLDGGVLWTATGGGTTPSGVVRSDTTSGEVGAPVPLEGSAVDLASGGGELWALTLLDPEGYPKGITGALTALHLDPDTGQTTASVPVADAVSVGTNAQVQLVVAPDGQVWVGWENQLARIDPATDAVADTIDLPEGSYDDLVASGSVLWVGGRDASGVAGSLLRVDPADASVEPVPVDSAVYSLAPASGGAVWVGLGQENTDAVAEVERGAVPGTGSVVRVDADGPVGDPLALDNPLFELESDGNLVWGVDSIDGEVVRIVPSAGTAEAVATEHGVGGLTVGEGDAFADAGTEVLEIAPFEAAEVPAGSTGTATPEEPAGPAGPQEAAAAWIEAEGLVNLGACDVVFGVEGAAESAGPDDLCIDEPTDDPGGGAHVTLPFVSTFGEDRVTLYATETDGVWTADVSACISFLGYDQPTPEFLLAPDGSIQLDEQACSNFSEGDGGAG